MFRWYLLIPLLILELVKSSHGQWSHIANKTGDMSGNLGAKYNFGPKTYLGGYLHGDLNSRPIINGGGIVGGKNLGNGWSIGGGIGHNPGGWHGNIGIKKTFGRKRRSNDCMTKCNRLCPNASRICLKNCFVHFC